MTSSRPTSSAKFLTGYRIELTACYERRYVRLDSQMSWRKTPKSNGAALDFYLARISLAVTECRIILNGFHECTSALRGATRMADPLKFPDQSALGVGAISASGYSHQ